MRRTRRRKWGKIMIGIGRLAAAAFAAFAISVSGSARAYDLVGLTDRSQLVLFTETALSRTTVVDVTGLSAPLLGIDFRPANKRLYGVAANSTIYTIDPRTGAASFVANLSEPFVAARGAVVDFNPQADRLRLISDDGKLNYRINVDTGAVIKDKPLAYEAKDKGAGMTPMILAGAYINSYAGAPATQLFHIDSARGAWIVQDPPNDGILGTIAETGTGKREIRGLDILTDAKDDYVGYAIDGTMLVEISVAKGTAKTLGRIGDGRLKLIDLAFVPVR
jgi:hypothetical protein